MITGLYAAILCLWLAFLLLNVVRGRWKNKVGLGDGGNADMIKRIRIHGNFVETVPFVLIIMILLEMQNYNSFIIHGFGLLMIASRLLHFVGLSQSETTSFGRFAGTVIFVSLLVIGALLLLAVYL